MLNLIRKYTSRVRSNHPEQTALKVSLFATALLGCTATLFAIWADSAALLLDGAFGLSDILFSWAALKVSRLIQNGHSKNYPFGYHAFEAFLNLVNALMAMALLVFSALMALIAISHGGRHPHSLSVAIFALFSAMVCLLMWRFTDAKAKESGSALLKLDVVNWQIDGLITLAISIGFFMATLIEHTFLARFAPYFDPMIVLFVCIIAFPEPLSIFKRFLKQLLGANTMPALSARINSLYTLAFLQNSPTFHACIHEDLDIECKSLELGRMIYIWIELKVPCDHKLAQLCHQFELRTDLERLYRHNFKDRNVCVDVIFTPAMQDLQFLRYA